jgi:hypothetical protein
MTLLDPRRIGRITASNFYKIMATPRGGGFSQGALTYLDQVVGERLTGLQTPSVGSTATMWGLEQEPYALDHFATDYHPVEAASFVEYGIHAGCTPDAKVLGSPLGVEVKCPYASATMVKVLRLADIREEFPEHYYQVMSSLMFTGWDKWYLAYYDPRMGPEYRMKVFNFEPDANEFLAMSKRLKEAIEYVTSPLS